MQYDLSFNITALVFLYIIIHKYFSQRQFPLLSTKLYGYILVLAAAGILFEILGTVSLSLVHVLPMWLCYFLNYMCFVTYLLLAPTIALYIVALVSPKAKVRTSNLILIAMPAVIGELILAYALINGYLFRIAECGRYEGGPISRLAYFLLGIFICIYLYLMVYYRAYIRPVVRNTFIMIGIVLTLASGIQYFFSRYMVTSVGITISLLLVYFTLESPESMTDSITKLQNYATFEMLLNTRFASGSRFKIVVSELHGLRKINTIYGVKEGDRILKEIADYLSGDRKTWVFRIEPTRFAMITKDSQAYERYLKNVIAIRNSSWLTATGEMASVTINTCHIEHADIIKSTEDLLNIIDRAMMEQDKWEGPGVYELDQSVIAAVDKRAKLAVSLAASLEKGEHFVLYYQPIYNCSEEKFTCVEALLRYDHPDMGFISPAEFFPLIEAAGLNSKVDDLVVRLAVKDMASGLFRSLGISRININLTSASLINLDNCKKLIEAMKTHSIEPSSVAFEITERIAADSREELRRFMGMLGSYGIKFAIDDFGMGYSNLASILDLPFDILKFDKSLLDLGKPFEYIAPVMEKLCPITVAEGVETEQQAELVKRLGISYIQGYYYSSPMSREDLKAFIQSRECPQK